MKGEKTFSILLAEDDPDDQLLNQEAIEEANLGKEVRFVSDGEELLDYLLRRGKYSQPSDSPRPDLIFLDLNMPRMDGREALVEIKKFPELRRIPIVVLTTSRAEEDISYSYGLGVSGYITKPSRFDELVKAMKVVGKYWFETVRLPSER